MEFDNIVLMFGEMSGCDVEKINENLSLINNAVMQLSGLIEFEKCTPTDIKNCEYATAVCAVFDFVCKESAKEKIITTADGKTSSSIDYSKRIEGAKYLKETALKTIKGVLKDNDFLFMKM